MSNPERSDLLLHRSRPLRLRQQLRSQFLRLLRYTVTLQPPPHRVTPSRIPSRLLVRAWQSCKRCRKRLPSFTGFSSKGRRRQAGPSRPCWNNSSACFKGAVPLHPCLVPLQPCRIHPLQRCSSPLRLPQQPQVLIYRINCSTKLFSKRAASLAYLSRNRFK